MADKPEADEPEIVLICPRCSYHTPRTADRLRRDTAVLCPNCGATIVPPSNNRAPGQ